MPARANGLLPAAGLALTACLSAGAALAQAGPVARSMSCQNARAIVASRGAVILSTGPYAYDRYVSGSQFCVRGETTEPAWVPTADTPQCFVGYRCRDTDLEFSGR